MDPINPTVTDIDVQELMEKKAKIYVAGHTGLVGSALVKTLLEKGYTNLLLRTRKELDLIKQQEVFDFFEREKPEFVFLSAAKVGGIGSNHRYRGQFIYENLQIEINVVHASYLNRVKKMLFLGSTCIYPKESPQPISEDCLLASPLEYTNEPYALAKIAGINMCESYNLQYGTNFISVMPASLYGPNDRFDLETAHVLPTLLRKTILADYIMRNRWEEIRQDLKKRPIQGIDGTETKEIILEILNLYGIRKDKIEVWGTGNPFREFLWSEEMADACIFLMERVNFIDLVSGKKEIRNTHINIGTGKDISIRQLIKIICKVVGYKGSIYFNLNQPDGTARKLSDPTQLHTLGWYHKIEIEEGVGKLYDWYVK